MERIPTESYQVPRSKDLRPPSASPESDPTWRDLGVASHSGRADASKPAAFGLNRDPKEEDLLADPSDGELTRKIDRVFANLSKPEPERKKTHVWGAASAAGRTAKGKN